MDDRSIILGIWNFILDSDFDACSPSLTGVVLGASCIQELNWTFCWNLLAQTPLLTGISCIFSFEGSDVVVQLLVLFSWGNSYFIRLWRYQGFIVWNFAGDVLKIRHNPRILEINISGVLSCELCWTSSTQIGWILPSLIKVTDKDLSSNTTWYWGETWPVNGFNTRETNPT